MKERYKERDVVISDLILNSRLCEQKVNGLTIHTTTKKIEVAETGWRKKDFVLSVILIILVGVIWYFFKG